MRARQGLRSYSQETSCLWWWREADGLWGRENSGAELTAVGEMVGTVAYRLLSRSWGRRGCTCGSLSSERS